MHDERVVIIGPFPEPVHGMSLANSIVLEHYQSEEGLTVKYHDTTLERGIKNKQEQGRLQIKPLVKGVVNTLQALFYVVKYRKAYFYITPPQSLLGYLRSLPIILLASYCGKRTVIHFHGARFAEHYKKASFGFRWLIDCSLKKVSKVILLGQSIADSHRSVIPLSKISVCHNGVPFSDSNDLPAERAVTNLLFLSNLMKDKGVFDFFDAIEILDAGKFEVHIAGAIESQYQQEIEDRLAMLADKVTYHGVVSGNKKQQLFENSDIFVLPSYDEGQPLSILEAYAYGCAVVTTDVGGIPDIFKSGTNGELCQINTPSSIANAIFTILNNGLKNYSMYNRKKAKSDFSELAFFQRIDQIIRGK